MRLKFIYLFVVFIVAFICILPVSNYAVQDMENPCFFCHADLFFELRDGAHEVNGIDCFACHGRSEGHNNAEDNSIKPEILIKKSDAAGFCGNCHEKELEDFTLSIHAKGIGNIKNAPTCTDCHSGHLFEKKIDQKVCLGCHGGELENDNSITEIPENELELYHIHSLERTDQK